MRVVLDGVFNHASRGFWPFNHVMETGKASPYRDWFYLNDEDLEAGRPLRAFPNEGLLDALASTAVSEEHRLGVQSLQTLGYRAWWDLPALPKLKVENPAVREYLLGVAEHWLRFGIDGWRLDVPEEIEDQFWQEFRRRVKTIDPEAYIVAEVWTERPEFLQGDMYDAFMNYPFAEAVLSFVSGIHLDLNVTAQQFWYHRTIRPDDGPAFGRRLEHVFSMYDPAVTAVQLNLIGSHDTPRALTVCGGDLASMRLATLVQMTVPGAPSIYYGDEIGMAGGNDPESRGAFPWDESAWDRGLLEYTAAAAALRNANPALRDGAFDVVAADGMVCVYRRTADDASFLVALNAGEDARDIEVCLPDLADRRLVGQPLPARGGEPMPAEPIPIGTDGRATLTLAARDGAVLRAV
jgi:neopullulanase